ncbi:zinc knuckle CX2CX4HX4C containing protein [Tanacetum coccineum]|uniref:Zinc knuckle CX2CX4HX4C containing protein n=1 Tax=Tanacetum coccineum TaxID=301880 RepID=A0ABQ5HCT8_9ASTR
MNTRLCKEELTRIPVWVKIHDVPIQVFSEDGLSIIASQIGKPIMLDSYTSSMCIESWGRSSFARCLIEINANDILKESLTMGVPLLDDHCPKKVSVSPTVFTPTVITPNVENTNDGFQTVGKKKKKGKSKSTNGGQSVKGAVRINLLRLFFPSSKEDNITMSNSYAALDEESDEDVKNVYDESANLFHGSKSGGSSSSFTVVVG